MVGLRGDEQFPFDLVVGKVINESHLIDAASVTSRALELTLGILLDGGFEASWSEKLNEPRLEALVRVLVDATPRQTRLAVSVMMQIMRRSACAARALPSP